MLSFHPPSPYCLVSWKMTRFMVFTMNTPMKVLPSAQVM
jgi:hypothetical protein